MSNPAQRVVQVGVAQRVVQVGIQGAPGVSAETNYESVETDVSVLTGQPLHLKNSGHADLAQADTIATARVCGLAIAPAIATTAVSYKLNGTITQTDWSGVTDSPALVPGATYYLDPLLPGRLTLIAPELIGQLVVIVGAALSTNKLAIQIHPPIQL